MVEMTIKVQNWVVDALCDNYEKIILENSTNPVWIKFAKLSKERKIPADTILNSILKVIAIRLRNDLTQKISFNVTNNICDKFSHEEFEKPCPIIDQICDDCQYLKECDDCDKIEALEILLDEEHAKNEKLKETINKMCGLKIQVPKETEQALEINKSVKEIMDKIHSMGRNDKSHIMFVTPRISKLKNCNALFSMAAYCNSNLNKTKTIDEKIELLLKEVDLSIKSKIIEWKQKAIKYDKDKDFKQQIHELLFQYGYLGLDKNESLQNLIVQIDIWKEKSVRYDELISKLEDECDNAYEE